MDRTTASPPPEATPDRAPVKSVRRLGLMIVLLAFGFLVAHSAEEYSDAMEQRSQIIDEAMTSAKTLLLSLDEHLVRTIRATEPIITLAAAEIEGSLAGQAISHVPLQQAFQVLHRGAPQLASVGFIDARGLATDDRDEPKFLDVSDRDFFRYHRDNASTEIRIGEPTISRITRQVILPITRRVDDADGGFAGVVIGTLNPRYLESFYSKLESRIHVLALLTDTGALLASIPEVTRVGTSFARMPVFTRLLAQKSEGWHARPADDVDEARHVVYRRVSGLPFVLIATIPDTVLLEPWWADVRSRVWEGVWIFLVLALFTSLLLRNIARQGRLADGLAASEARYRDLIDASSDWHWEMGPDLRFTTVRDQRRAGSLPYEEVIGRSRSDIVDPAGTPMLRQHLDDLAARRPFRDFVYRRILDNGDVRYTTSSGKPIFGTNGEFLGYRGTAADVTNTMLAEERLTAARKLLGNAIETLHDGFVLFDAQDRFVQCNSKFRELYGDSAGLLLPGTHYETILRRAVERGQFPEAKGREEKWIKSALAYHHIKASTRQRLLPGRRWVEVREVRLEDGGSAGIHIDITEAKRAEEKLRENEERLRSITANMPGAVLEYALGDDNIIRHLYVSERIREVTGYTAQELMDDPLVVVKILGEERYAASADRLRAAAKAMAPLEAEYPFIRRDGAQRWARSSTRPRRLPSGEVLWDVLLLDVTEQKAAEAERRELENQLRHLQRLEAVGTLAGGMAHEINNKLVPIVTFSDLMLMQTPEDSPSYKPLSLIQESAARIRDLVARILAMSRSETAGNAPMNLQPAATNAVSLLRATLPPNVQLTLEAEPVGRVLGDESQIEQVLVNLGTNAAHAIGNNQGQVRIRLDEVDAGDGIAIGAGGLPAGRYARIQVIDDGGGMSPQTMQRIFEPFFTTKGVGEGTGLGLSIVHGIIASHRGRISVDSELGRGTTFTVLLPLAVEGAGNDENENGPSRSAAAKDNPLGTFPQFPDSAIRATQLLHA